MWKKFREGKNSVSVIRENFTQAVGFELIFKDL